MSLGSSEEPHLVPRALARITKFWPKAAHEKNVCTRSEGILETQQLHANNKIDFFTLFWGYYFQTFNHKYVKSKNNTIF